MQSLFRDSPDSSSFGPIGFIAPVSAGRLKGFIGGGVDNNGRIVPVESIDHAEFIGDVISEGIRRLGSTGNTRLTLRTIVRNDALRCLTDHVEAAGANMEAVLQVNADYSIVYIGHNVQSRELTAETRDSHQGRINSAILDYGSNAEALAGLARDINVSSNEYYTRIIDGSERSFSILESGSIYRLLSTFGHTAESAETIISDPHNIIGLVYQNMGVMQSVVGISITETRGITLSDGTVLHISELTDGTVSRHGRSLYPLLLSDVFGHIANNRPDISLVYAESNVMSEPLMRTAAIQGRNFSGMLPNNADIVNKNTGHLEHKSFAVTSLTREQLIASVERLEMERAAQQSIRA